MLSAMRSGCLKPGVEMNKFNWLLTADSLQKRPDMVPPATADCALRRRRLAAATPARRETRQRL
jgi:hypothetical protein